MSVLSGLYAEIARCARCEIAKTRTNAVPGEGPEDAEVMLVGEAPGWHEDQSGRPFVGPAGQFLEELLSLGGLKRQDVYITNVIKCRPTNNREPLPQEIVQCRPYLERQIELIRPKVIITLGRHSLAFFSPSKSISQAHGSIQEKDGIIFYAMYHPAAALHQQSLREVLKNDALKIPQALAEARKPPVVEKTVQAQQLSLF